MATLQALRDELADRLGYASMAITDVPTMRMLTSLLKRAQEQLYWQYQWDELVRIWKASSTTGSLDAASRFTLPLPPLAVAVDGYTWEIEPRRIIDVWCEYVGDHLPLREGIAPDVLQYTTRGYPTRYQFQANRIELHPQPNTGEPVDLFIQGYAKLRRFEQASDELTLDESLVFSLALALGKAQLGQPDANIYAQESQAMLSRLRAYSHGNRRYVPGTDEARDKTVTPRPVRV